jgi:hypothetical protein
VFEKVLVVSEQRMPSTEAPNDLGDIIMRQGWGDGIGGGGKAPLRKEHLLVLFGVFFAVPLGEVKLTSKQHGGVVCRLLG